MSWTWQSIGDRKHLVWHGRVVCDAVGVPDENAVVPCRYCVEQILAIERSVFAE
jgi:hypothetical protein